jgi:uncharacterized protein YbaP (TraB family)
MLKYLGAAMAAVIALASVASAQSRADDKAQVDDIVVTGRRSGVPLWTVRGETTTLVLVGALQGVSKTTHWDPTALTEALRKADRVMFPQSQSFTASLFSAIGWVAKYKAMGSLPKGQSLADFAGPDEMRRLAALRARGMVRSDYPTRHPLHLAGDLRDRAKGDIDYAPGAADYVRRAVKKYDLVMVPIRRSKAKPLVKDLFASTPDEHLPCLRAAIAMAEAGPAAVQARSDAWAARRVPEVIASPADGVYESCWPAVAVLDSGAELTEEMKLLLSEPQVTVAVLNLRSLAEPGGVLDGLQAAGYDIQGPAWK